MKEGLSLGIASRCLSPLLADIGPSVTTKGSRETVNKVRQQTRNNYIATSVDKHNKERDSLKQTSQQHQTFRRLHRNSLVRVDGEVEGVFFSLAATSEDRIRDDGRIETSGNCCFMLLNTIQCSGRPSAPRC